ncbi:NUDIX domain-containing protein [Candidatus Parcubacteria bacterium]|nr:NUDIX domain-containing protein [Candidatus Parcubacteria bacterium]
MSTEPQRPRVGLGVVVIRDRKVLVGHRSGSHGEGTWCIPGGHVEFGESWESCARREVREETGLEIEQVQFLGVTDDWNIGEGKHYVTIFMRAACPEGEPRVCEPDRYTQLMWCEWERIPFPRFKPMEHLMKQGVHPLATYYGKLVHDRIPELMESRGVTVMTHGATMDEYHEALKAKLVETVGTFLESGETDVLADVLETVQTLTALLGTSREQLQLIQSQKKNARGGFEKRIILDETR